MSYTIDSLIADFQRKQKLKFLFFWGHQPAKNGELTASCFSQWWESPFEVEGIRYATAEHWMMAQKAALFNDTEAFQRVIAAKSPGEAKQIGRQVRGFDDMVWNDRRYEVVVQGNKHKFSQHEALKTFLINTNDRVLVEASPVDLIWGIGLAASDERAANPSQWNGLNLLGFALMDVRDQLRQEP
ncbi:NADAR family protein [Fibrella sp. WM1]|uniref:NADAR family protein n=1 Tax=Fibrella musci TaxID=3242485 RepID=UPI003520395C